MLLGLYQNLTEQGQISSMSENPPRFDHSSYQNICRVPRTLLFSNILVWNHLIL